METGLAAGVGGALCFGIAAVLQALAARREPTARRVDPWLVVRLLRQPVFVVAVLANLAGFVLHVVALRELPLFLAQAVTSTSVIVTAGLASRILHVPLTRGAVAAVGALAVGITLLAVVASGTGTVQPDTDARLALLGLVAAVAAAGAAVGRLPGALGASLLGVVAGLAFAISAVAARVLTGLDPLSLLVDPAAYALVAAGPLGFLLYSTGLQRAGVLTVTAPVLVLQTAGPAAAGLLLLGDRVRPGGLPLGVVGLAVAVAGALALARFDPQVLVARARAARDAAGSPSAEARSPSAEAESPGAPPAGAAPPAYPPAPRPRRSGTVGATTRGRCAR